MNVVLNGDDTELADGITVHALVAELHGVRRGIAVAVDGEVVPRSTWGQSHIRPGARVEILVAVQGG